MLQAPGAFQAEGVQLSGGINVESAETVQDTRD